MKLLNNFIFSKLHLPNLEENYFYCFETKELLDEQSLIEFVEKKVISIIVIGGSIIPWIDKIG